MFLRVQYPRRLVKTFKSVQKLSTVWRNNRFDNRLCALWTTPLLAALLTELIRKQHLLIQSMNLTAGPYLYKAPLTLNTVYSKHFHKNAKDNCSLLDVIVRLMKHIRLTAVTWSIGWLMFSGSDDDSGCVLVCFSFSCQSSHWGDSGDEESWNERGNPI